MPSNKDLKDTLTLRREKIFQKKLLSH